ncbi:hypothetical protein V498_07708, partial [Pseudogymnoascus sp. VKM F-4517 (FW-2822)]
MASTHSVQIDMTSYHPSSATATGVESLQTDLDDRFPSCYGVFQEYYSTSDEFAGSSNIAVVGACAMGIMYMDISIWFAVLKYFPNFRKWATPVGLTIVCLALGLGSFSTTVGHLIITQGIIYALGGGLAFTPVLFYIEEWWVRRRGFAYGTTMAGLGLSGAILPVVLEWLLHSYGFRTTLRVCALSFVALNLPVLFFFRPRLPLSQTTQSRSFDMSFWVILNLLKFSDPAVGEHHPEPWLLYSR